jgi:large subunit ribosomal protein L15
MKLDEILSAAGRHKRRKRIGRGTGSGHGKTSGRGHKGYGARAGAKCRAGYEGGQTPIVSRIPKRGFNNFNFRKEFQIVNLVDLQDAFDDGARVDVEALKQAKLIDSSAKAVKILGDGELKKKLTVVADRFSASAAARITQAGGSVESLAPAPEPKKKKKPAKARKAKASDAEVSEES